MRSKYSLLTGVIFIAFFLCMSIMVNGQSKQDDYSARWKSIDALVDKGLTKSALKEVNQIYSDANKSNNSTQIIKALLYKVTLQQNITEDASVKSIDTLEREIALAKEPAKSILESITAQMYWTYFQQNRYKIYNRTNTTNFNKKDIATWTSDDLHKKIGDWYLASLVEKKLLQKTSLEPFDAVIKKGNVRYLRPTLYDFLAHRALDYFKNDEQDITRPSYAFEIKDVKAFAPASEFVQYKFDVMTKNLLYQTCIAQIRWPAQLP